MRRWGRRLAAGCTSQTSRLASTGSGPWAEDFSEINIITILLLIVVVVVEYTPPTLPNK